MEAQFGGETEVYKVKQQTDRFARIYQV
jgi:hypothetical protein